jgi:hypothetical protein
LAGRRDFLTAFDFAATRFLSAAFAFLATVRLFFLAFLAAFLTAFFTAFFADFFAPVLTGEAVDAFGADALGAGVVLDGAGFDAAGFTVGAGVLGGGFTVGGAAGLEAGADAGFEDG